MNKLESIQLKGIAIIFMFIHHIAGCGTFLVAPENTCSFLLGNYFIYFASGCKICIAIFAFISGYGIYKSLSQNTIRLKNIIRIIKFLLSYWIMLFLIAVPYLLITNKLNINCLIINLFALLHNDDILYLSFSWYVKVYLEFLILSPIIIKLSERIKNILLESLLFIALPILLSRLLPDAEASYVDFFTNFLSSLRLILCWYPLFHIGIIFSKYNIFNKICLKSNSNKTITVFLSLIGIFIAIICRHLYIFSAYTDTIVLLIFIVSYYSLTKILSFKIVSKLLSFLGKYSFQYWLISGMFFLNTIELQKYLFWPKYPILVLLWGFIIITPFAVLSNKISGLVNHKIEKIFFRSLRESATFAL